MSAASNDLVLETPDKQIEQIIADLRTHDLPSYHLCICEICVQGYFSLKPLSLQDLVIKVSTTSPVGRLNNGGPLRLSGPTRDRDVVLTLSNFENF